MSIDVEPKDLGPVVQLVANSEGWKQYETRYRFNRSIFITGNTDQSVISQTPADWIEPLKAAWLMTKKQRPKDYNGSKVAVRNLAVEEGILYTEGVETDYFTVWGLPKADASKDLFAEHERQVVINQVAAPNAFFETKVPWALCSHNILLDPNGRIIMMVRSRSVGFSTGKISATQEKQMNPMEDPTPFTV